jgi:hypothetical protein
MLQDAGLVSGVHSGLASALGELRSNHADTLALAVEDIAEALRATAEVAAALESGSGPGQPAPGGEATMDAVDTTRSLAVAGPDLPITTVPGLCAGCGTAAWLAGPVPLCRECAREVGVAIDEASQRLQQEA